MALVKSQATLHCVPKAVLYDAGMSIGKRIKEARERLKPKLTQDALGDLLGITGAAVSGWERGPDSPEISRIPALRRALRVTYAWLHEGGDTPPPDPDAPEVVMDDMAADASPARTSVAKAVLGLRKRSGT